MVTTSSAFAALVMTEMLIRKWGRIVLCGFGSIIRQCHAASKYQ